MSVAPSPQQSAIMDELKSSSDHVSVRALAGTGKTTTIQMCQPIASGLNVAFNRVVRETFKQRMPEAENHTFNSLGHQIISRNLGKRLKFDQDKIKVIRDQKKIRWSDCPDLFRILDLARSGGLGFGEYSLADATDPREWNEIIEEFELDAGTVDRSVFPEILMEDYKLAASGTIDFGDQLWFPIVANLSLGVPFPIIYIDEAQDVNGIQIALIEKYARRSRICLVGDPHQAIYGFRGSVNGSMLILESNLGAKPFPLSVTYRCPKAIVELARTKVSEYEAHPSAPEGEVHRLGRNWKPSDIEPGSAILCRNNAPLISLALVMISQGIPAAVRGREIGKSLVTLAKTIIKEYSPTTKDQFERCLDMWRVKKLSEGKRSEGSVNERCDALLALVSGCGRVDVREIEAKAERLFTDKGATVLLSTIHKAKGLEWPTVYFLNDWMIPSIFSRSVEALRQEDNIWYVGVTRAMKKLVFIDSGRSV